MERRWQDCQKLRPVGIQDESLDSIIMGKEDGSYRHLEVQLESHIAID